MTLSFIQLALTPAVAVVVIAGLGLVAVLIGYLTAWLYAKSKYVPVINGLQKDKDELTAKVQDLSRQVEVMKSEIIKLNGTIELQSEKIKSLEKIIEEKNAEIKKISKPLKEN